LVLRPDDGDTVLAGSEQRSAHGGRRDRPHIEGRSLDEQHGSVGRSAKPGELTEEPPRGESPMKIVNALPLHERATGTVVADRQCIDVDSRSEAGEVRAHHVGLVHVDNDGDRLTSHPEIVSRKASHVCTNRSRAARTS
jgi:hypothetical protein